ncbi:hypothetical protein X965_07460 [Morganella sp. EGD-HP17]|nr:hypothetical protein X965_07460 [Morganella sp. EGD-HP17]
MFILLKADVSFVLNSLTFCLLFFLLPSGSEEINQIF